MSHGQPQPARRARHGSVLVKVIIALVLLAGLAAVAYAAVRAMRSDASSSTAPDLFEVARRDFEVTSTASGELQAKRETRLASQVEGRVAIVTIVPEGTFVRQDQVLVQLSQEALQTELIDDELRFNSAKSELTAAEESLAIQQSDNDSSLRQAELKVRLAELELDKWLKGDVKERRLQLALDVERAEREEKRLKDKLEKQEKLYAREFISSDELERDRIAYIEAQSQLAKAELARKTYEEYTYKKDEARLTSDVEEAKAELDRTIRRNRSLINSKESDLANKQRQLNIRTERVEHTRQQLEATTIKAPTSGLVVYATSVGGDRWRMDEAPLQVGREVNHNEELIVLPDTAEMVANIRIHESRIGEIEVGMPVNLTIDAAQGRVFTGTVASIGIMAESGGWRDPNNREYQVRVNINLDQENHGLKPSMRCEAEVIMDTVEDVVAVPVQAVFNEGPVTYVFLDEAGMFRRQPVRIGRRSDTYAEIVDGLDVNDIVCLREPALNRVIADDFSDEVVASYMQPDPRRAGRARSGPVVREVGL
ncbi:MAG: HlyD family efflux transporter periplasmic adaptor subunit [Phycisphaerales bacterium]|nr:HlyD family efflux transporter periplasmic adaptor subunit [Phycisphaerales bacterium]